MSDYVYINDNVTITTTGTNVTFDPPPTLRNGDTLTLIFDEWPATTTTTTTGTWMGAIPTPPDMTDWPADDIIDHFAIDLARRRPA